MVFMMVIIFIVCSCVLGSLMGPHSKSGNPLFVKEQSILYTWCKWFISGMVPCLVVLVLTSCTIASFMVIFGDNKFVF